MFPWETHEKEGSVLKTMSKNFEKLSSRGKWQNIFGSSECTRYFSSGVKQVEKQEFQNIQTVPRWIVTCVFPPHTQLHTCWGLVKLNFIHMWLYVETKQKKQNKNKNKDLDSCDNHLSHCHTKLKWAKIVETWWKEKTFSSASPLEARDVVLSEWPR